MISNLNNPTIREIRKLRKRRERDRRHEVIVEGHRALAVALRAKGDVSRVLHTRSASDKRSDLLREARAAGAALFEVSPAVMSSLTSVETAPDVLGVAPMPSSTLEEAVARLGLGAVLSGVKDPATAGSILSSCAAAGGAVAIATTGTTDLFAAKPVRSAAGAHFVLSIVPDVSPERCAEALRAAGARIVAVDQDGQDPELVDLDGPLAVLVAEHGAAPDALTAQIEARAAVGNGPSGIRPSVAAEAAVVLFELARRRRAGGEPPRVGRV